MPPLTILDILKGAFVSFTLFGFTYAALLLF